MKKRRTPSASTQILLIAAIVIVINILSDRIFFRLDFTADKSYTLSKATKNILRNLEDPITITAYFTEDVPADFIKVRKDFKDMLTEYENVSRGNVVYEFIDPNKGQELEQQAMQAGIMPSIVNVRERDEMSQKRVFFGAVLKKGNDKEVIPVIQPGAAMEYELSASIKKLTIVSKPTIGFIQGHGEPSQAAMTQAVQELNFLYNLESVDLNSQDITPQKYPTLVMVAPKDTVPQHHLNALDRYLAQGGNLFIAMDRVEGNFSTVQGTSKETGLERWLENKGLTVENSFIVDANCGRVAVQQQSGFMNFTTQVAFPYIPVIKNFEEHPITSGLEEVVLEFASPINFTGTSSVLFTPLAKTSDKSGTMAPPLYFDINKQWTDRDFPLSKLTVAGVLSGNITGNIPSKIILVTDGAFAVNGEGQRPQQLQPDNVNLFVNSIDWLTDQTGLIELRTKAVTSRPLDNVEDGRKAFLKWLNFLLPIGLAIAYGVFRIQRKRIIRLKRMEEGYV